MYSSIKHYDHHSTRHGDTDPRCSCKGCKCNYKSILLIQSLLLPGSVPTDKTVTTQSRGFGTVTILNNKTFYINIFVNFIHDCIMSHIHIKNTSNPKTNGPIVLWLTNTQSQPVSVENSFLVSKMFSSNDFVGPLKGYSIEEFLHYLGANQLYFNVHTVKYPNGEIAGDLLLSHSFQ